MKPIARLIFIFYCPEPLSRDGSYFKELEKKTMAVVAPFRGVRYNPEKIERLEDVVTPPYDVISTDDEKKLLQKTPYSMINLDLRNISQGTTEDDGRYKQAQERFQTWQDENVLVQDEQPAIYLYYIDYNHPNGKRLTRKGIVSLVGLAEFAEGIVKPHEKTFSGVISDRLQLMETCKAQFSQIFSIYSDREQEVITNLEKARHAEPLLQVDDQNANTHTLWRVTDKETLKQVHHFFSDKSVYIADGHHRYTTALDCRRRALAQNPNLPADHPCNYIMMYLCACEDAGLSVLPTHRLVRWPGAMTADQLQERMQQGMIVTEVKQGGRETLIAEVMNRMNEADTSHGTPAFGVYHPGEDRAFLLQMQDETISRSPCLADKPEVLQELDVVVLSDLLIQDYLGLNHDQCVNEGLVSYLSDPDVALDEAVKASVLQDTHTPLLFLLNPTKVEQVLKVADSDNIMPHKSTYFYPKIMTGLLVNKLDDEQHIQPPS
ncbi:MAG: DUF1015 domain-containing protein [Candidatus Electrothrix sp. GW3-4]|uniref:DUF1015 domain-containing protein n=1 Tax=Candidatus Electrothrix sp. GW3-4 TaxID=3126740 RepID=UPI0030D17158